MPRERRGSPNRNLRREPAPRRLRRRGCFGHAPPPIHRPCKMTRGPRDTVGGRMRGMRGFMTEVGKALYESADLVRSEAHRSISAGSISGKNHTPSAPGSPPNRDTGVLQANLAVDLISPVKARVTSRAPYSAALEFGTSKMEARPFLRPARDAMKPRAASLLKKRINDAIRKHRGKSK